MADTYALNRGSVMVTDAAEAAGLARPWRIEITDSIDFVAIDFGSDMGTLSAWAAWAGLDVVAAEPWEYLPGRWSVAHTAAGDRFDVPVRLAAREYGSMTSPEFYECAVCGASFGHTGGFVADGEYDTYFDAETRRHESGECAPTAPQTTQEVGAGVR